MEVVDVEDNMNKKTMIGIAIIMVIGIGFFSFKGFTGNVITASGLIDEGEILKIPMSGIRDKVEFYDYEGIEFFTVTAKDGTPKTAFDACDVCHSSKKGYRQQGGDMICNNCGNYYPISGIGTRNLRGGGCWPGYLPTNIEGDYLVIKKTDLEKGRFRFN